MPMLNKFQIPKSTRNHHLQEYRKQLSKQLSTPGLSEETKKELRFKLATLGRPRDYTA